MNNEQFRSQITVHCSLFTNNKKYVMKKTITNITALFLLLLCFGAVQAQVDDKGVTSTGKEVDCSTINPSVDQAVDQYGAIVTRPTLTRNGKIITDDCGCPIILDCASCTDTVTCVSITMSAPILSGEVTSAVLLVFSDASYSTQVSSINATISGGKITAAAADLSCHTRYYLRLILDNKKNCTFDWTDSTRDMKLEEPTACDVLLKFANEHSSAAGTIDSVYDHEGNAYTVVQIGNQCWLRENMRAITRPSNGDTIMKNSGVGNSNSDPRAYYYDNSMDNYKKYGCLYNFPGVMDIADQRTDFTYPHRGICPEGWHVPTDAEWATMENAVVNDSTVTDINTTGVGYQGSSTELAVMLAGGCDWKDASGDDKAPNNYSNSSRNSTDFSAIPAGLYSGGFNNVGNHAYFWSATPLADYNAYNRFLYYIQPGVNREQNNRDHGFSVRCLRDFLIPSVTLCGDCEDSTIVIKAMTNTDSLVLLNSAKAQIKTMSQPVVDTAFTSLQPGKYYVMSISYTGGTALDSITLTLQNTSCDVLAKLANEHSSAAGTIDSVYDHEGNAYTVVQIGNQCWLRENMRATTSPSTGHRIVLDNIIKSYSSKAASYYLNDSQKYAKYGVFYNWCAALDTFYNANGQPEVANGSGHSSTLWTPPTYNHRRGICPKGWHIPTPEEWFVMLGSAGVDTSTTSGIGVGKLVAGCDWIISTGNLPTMPSNYNYEYRNESGFSALPSGSGATSADETVQFGQFGQYAHFQTSLFNGQYGGWTIRINNEKEYARYVHMPRSNELSVRCVRDAQTKNYCTVDLRLDNEEGSVDGRIDSVADHEGNWYKVVEIGDQCWLAENMRCTTSPKGNLTSGGQSYYKAYYYDYSSSPLPLRERGYLYNWAGALDTNASAYIVESFTNRRGICPEGWHLSTDEEWVEMEMNYLRDADGNPLTKEFLMSDFNYRGYGAGKFTDGNAWDGTGTGTAPNNYSYSKRNITGFSAVPAGLYYYNGSAWKFVNSGNKACFWSSTSNADKMAYSRDFDKSHEGVNYTRADKRYGYSVRCVRNTPAPATISFNAIGGSGTMTAMNVTTMKDTVLKANTLIRENATFKCWSTDRSGCGTLYVDESHITTTSDMTLYAQWNTNCTVTSVRSNEIGSGQVDSLKDVDGNKYAVVQIGNQCWMKENLKTTRYADSTNIQLGNVPSSDIAYRYNPNGEASNVAVYGYLYNWPAIMNRALSSTAIPSGVQGVCPDGWHVPSNAEWNLMLQAVAPPASNFDVSSTGVKGASTDIAALLSGGCSWKSDPKAKTAGNAFDNSRNASCFTALPAAYYTGDETDLYPHFEEWAIFGTSTGTYKDYVIEYNSTGIRYNNNTPAVATSVRCVRDVECEHTTATSCDVPHRLLNEHQSAIGVIDSVYDHEGNDYGVVQIGNQCWLKENMRCTTSPRQGQTMGSKNMNLMLQSNTSTYSNYVPYYYDYSITTGSAPQSVTDLRDRGYLYNWSAAVDTVTTAAINKSFVNHRGICPEGWHLPTDNEWWQLEKTALTGFSAGDSTKADAYRGEGVGKLTGGCSWIYNGAYETAPGNYYYANRNSTGFTALPVGVCDNAFKLSGEVASYWSSTTNASSNGNAFRRYIDYKEKGVYRSGAGKYGGFSVRCLRNTPTPATISFHANGGTGSMTAMSVTTMTTDTVLDANTFTHDGNWAFRGWNTKMDGTGTAYEDGANIIPGESMTLYAQWHTWCDASSVRAQSGSDQSHEHGYNGAADKIDSVYDHQGNAYAVVQIGGQCWLAENMRCTTSPTTRSTIVMNPIVQSLSSKSAGWYNNDSTTYGKYGVLYNWCAAVDTFYAEGSRPELANATGPSSTSWNVSMPAGNRRGICPEGWHVPKEEEWATLATNAGCTNTHGSGTGVGKLTGGCDWSSHTGAAATAPGNYSYSERNSSGFTALPAGGGGSSFNDVGSNAYFWSATPNGSNAACLRYFAYNCEYVRHDYVSRTNGYSVRCVRDVVELSVTSSSETEKLCGSNVSITYTASLTGSNATQYNWSTTGGTPSPSTSNTYTVSYNTADTYKVICTVAGVSDTVSVQINSATAATLSLCEDKDAGMITVKEGNCTSLTWVYNADDSKTFTTSGEENTTFSISGNVPAGDYTVTGTNNDGCTVTRTANLSANNVAHPCTVASLNSGTPIPGDKYANKEYGEGNQLNSVSDHEGNIYRVVQIGAQCWLAENMRAKTSPSTGRNIFLSSMIGAYESKAACYYENNDENAVYGVLYNWCAAVDTFATSAPEVASPDRYSQSWICTMPGGHRRGICPQGWHVPTPNEWSTMASSAGVNDDGGLGKLTGGCIWDATGVETAPGDFSYQHRNSTGFNAVPAGNYYNISSTQYGFNMFGEIAHFWTSNPNDALSAYECAFYHNSKNIEVYSNYRTAGFYVRCVRNN